ncbi:MAG: Rad52/Rad22 family DNA repair protein [Gemmataceae bacterium]
MSETQTIATRDPQVQAIATALAAPFEPKEVKFKPQMVKNNRALAMGYIDARLIQDRLDEVLGVENWQDKYEFLPDGSVVCRLRVKLGGRWITKTDVGSPSEQPDSGDRVKAAVSDALKRAAVKFGIGRYLYRLPAQWVDYDPVKKQLAQLPQLPAFAIPKPKAQTTATAAKATKVAPPSAATTETQPDIVIDPKTQAIPKAPPKIEPKPEAKAETPKASTNLPMNGQELHRRLQEYDAKLASQKLCVRGALLSHVTQAGVKAGYTANMADWTGPAIPFAVEAVKEFEQTIRGGKPEPRTAA